MPNKQSPGFSLVELSIVLVILGLLVGGILAGQSLIRAAELRSVSSESSRLMAAVNSFRGKYLGMPGDITNATKFWGSLGGTGADATCHALANNGTTATCDGDGDGTFGINAGSVVNQYELYRFWQHLANAGLVEGTYTGIGTPTLTPGVNVMPSRNGSTSYWVAFSGHSYAGASSTVYAGTTNTYGTDYGRNGLMLRSTTANPATSGSYPLKPEEAWNIDTKIDDGTPINGKIISNKGDGTNTFCTTTAGGVVGAADLTSTYKLDVPAKDCWLFFRGVL